MDLDEATRILKRQSGSQHEWAAAGAYLHSFYTSSEGQHMLKPATFTIDGKPRNSLGMSDAKFDAALAKLGRLARDQDPDAGIPFGTGVIGAQRSSGNVGGKKIMKLPAGELTSFYIGLDEDGDPALFQHVSANGAMDPGAVQPRSLTTDAVRRERAADASWSRRALHSINEMNQRFWEQHST